VGQHDAKRPLGPNARHCRFFVEELLSRGVRVASQNGLFEPDSHPFAAREDILAIWDRRLGDEMSEAKKTQYPAFPGRARDDWPKHIPKPEQLPTG
jgi:hypothetical protein